ncbi:MAG: MFS transporter [Planctomycetaceae bacterium]|nr:MFS transporter [Planctomycetaceae bacterium]
MPEPLDASRHPPQLTARGRYLILAAAFLGWMFSGVQMSLMNLATGSATTEFVRSGALDAALPLSFPRFLPNFRPPTVAPRDDDEIKSIVRAQSTIWFARYNSAFLLGGALGGLLFGWVGDRFGRVRAMALSIAWYSLFAGAAYFVATPEQLLLLRFIAAFGVGGMWPAGVSLASEAWSDVSRPLLAGLIGTSANVGIVLISTVALVRDVTPESWRWIMLLAALPLVLAAWVWFVVPESPSWLAARNHSTALPGKTSLWAVFRPPLLKLTLLGIALGAIPLLGGWGVTAWLILWTDHELGSLKPGAKALASIMRGGGATLGSLIGGWLADRMGRRTTYFLISLTSLTIAEFIYLTITPRDALFSPMVFLIGFVSTIYFGWLPLYLPELFPTALRATGTGVSFNFGRILTAIGVLGTGTLAHAFGGFAAAGRYTSLIYAVGMVVILFAPDTTRGRGEEGRGARG